VIPNLIGSTWQRPDRETLPVVDPATEEEIERVPLSSAADVDAAVRSAAEAYSEWALVPVMDRVRLLFRYRELLERHAEELAEIVTRHHGKTL
jgi:malonate-semialdehyde dehydrogenase (acetylating)/methylmalonate-semialdehyde dehydrogenase